MKSKTGACHHTIQIELFRPCYLQQLWGKYELERRIVLLCVRVCRGNKPQLNQYDKTKTAPPTPTTECCQLL